MSLVWGEEYRICLAISSAILFLREKNEEMQVKQNLSDGVSGGENLVEETG